MPAYRATGYEKPDQSVFIATPAYESVKAGYAISLAKTVEELTRRNIPRTINLLFGNCHVDDGRNDLVRDFLQNTTCTDLVFIDADIMWEPDAFLKLIRHDTDDIVAGAYPYKSNNGKFPVGKIMGGIEGGDGKRALIEVSFAPTGFMRIPRSVFEKIAPPGEGGKLNPRRRFFERRYTDKTYDGGDVTFCRKWISHGGKVFIDPGLTLTHIGEHRWRGNFSEYLSSHENAKLHTTQAKDPVPEYKPDYAEIPEIIDGIRKKGTAASAVDFLRLSAAYDNGLWQASAEFLAAVWLMALGRINDNRVLECGSGLSTVLLAAAGLEVDCLEESPEWAQKTDALLKDCGLDANIMVCPYDKQINWYDAKILPEIENNYGFIVIDGPRRRKEMTNRLYPLTNSKIFAPGALVANDDMLGTDKMPKGDWHQCNADHLKPFVVGRVTDGSN